MPFISCTSKIKVNIFKSHVVVKSQSLDNRKYSYIYQLLCLFESKVVKTGKITSVYINITIEWISNKYFQFNQEFLSGWTVYVLLEEILLP